MFSLQWNRNHFLLSNLYHTKLQQNTWGWNDKWKLQIESEKKVNKRKQCNRLDCQDELRDFNLIYNLLYLKIFLFRLISRLVFLHTSVDGFLFYYINIFFFSSHSYWDVFYSLFPWCMWWRTISLHWEKIHWSTFYSTLTLNCCPCMQTCKFEPLTYTR